MEWILCDENEKNGMAGMAGLCRMSSGVASGDSSLVECRCGGEEGR